MDSGLTKAYTVDAATLLTRDFGDLNFKESMEKIAGRRSRFELFKKNGLSRGDHFRNLRLRRRNHCQKTGNGVTRFSLLMKTVNY